jgi:ABC-type multidrug transport system fused ATPase/permease subunit
VLLAILDTVALYLISTIFASGGDTRSIRVEAGATTIVIVVGLFTFRSILSTLSTWHTMQVLSREEVSIGQQNFLAFLNSPNVIARGFELNDLFNVVDRGPGAMVSGVVLSFYSILAEALAGLLILATLIYLQPITALTTALFFVVVAVIQHRMISHRSTSAGQTVVTATQTVYDSLADAYMMGKVLSVMPSESLPTFMQSAKQSLASARTRSSFLSVLPRYFMELVLAFGLAIVTLTTYLTGGEAEAVQSITVFAAAGFRLLPMVNRIQSLILLVLTTAPSASLVTHDELGRAYTLASEPLDAENVIEYENVHFSYPGTGIQALTGVTLSLKRGLQYALIGPSGAGKTTLVDLGLGLLQPTSGQVRIATESQVGYVPQDTHVAKLTLDQNIAMEWADGSISRDELERTIKETELTAVQTQRAESGHLGMTSLSGGQKQRVGLARAFYRSPSLLFLDEVTSALDAETENLVMRSVHQLKGDATVVIVAHRLSTVRYADQVIYVDNGTVAGIGRFDELRAQLPQLQRQIELGSLGLSD